MMIENGEFWLPLIFLGLMGISMLIYTILDGYDLGIGILLSFGEDQQRDQMIASIGPFWDANETWLVLGIGILLVAFPSAHSLILSALYVPVLVMLVGLTLRGIAFDLRTKSDPRYRRRWENVFQIGSLCSSLAQGYMLGSYIVGFSSGWEAIVFSIVSAVCVTAAYVLIGACWLILKTDGQLQLKSIAWARRALFCTASGLVLVSMVNPWISKRIFDKWFSLPEIFGLILLPSSAAVLLFLVHRQLLKLPLDEDRGCGLPLIGIVAVFALSFIGLAYSFYPYVVPDQLTVWQASSSVEALQFILYGVLIVLPAIVGYTVFSHWVFWGKASDLSYG